MSFSGQVKEEIGGQFGRARHCLIGEIAGLFVMNGQIISNDQEGVLLKFSSENLTVVKKYFILIKKAFGFPMDISVKTTKNSKKSYLGTVVIQRQSDVILMLKALKIMNDDGQYIMGNALVHPLLLQSNCCKRAFIRGMFLVAGSITDPSRGYHFEIVVGSLKRAEDLVIILNSFSVEAKIVERKKNYVVYLKEGAQIVDLLNVMEAHVALMKLENVRILKEVRNSVNRQVNCETANIQKTVSAASKQREDIIYIGDSIGFGTLSEGLAEIARLRVEHSEATLKELGEMLDPPIGKSGVNHRLRKLSELAEQLRRHKEEEGQKKDSFD